MSRYSFGILILLIGVYYLAKNLGYSLGIGEIIDTYWPVIVIFLGMKWTVEGIMRFYYGLKRKSWISGRLLLGLVILGIGIVIQGNKLAWFSVNVGDVWNWTWPLLIIYYGLSMIFHANQKKGKYHKVMLKKNVKLDDRKNTVIGEVNLGEHASWNLEDIRLWHGVGDVYINLSTAIIPDKEVFIDLTGIIGDITVLVPRDLAIKVNVDVRIGDVQVFNHRQSGRSRFVSYVSENYQEAVQKVNLMISLSIGDVKVKQVD